MRTISFVLDPVVDFGPIFTWQAASYLWRFRWQFDQILIKLR